jgi:transposase-like protein
MRQGRGSGHVCPSRKAPNSSYGEVGPTIPERIRAPAPVCSLLAMMTQRSLTETSAFRLRSLSTPAWLYRCFSLSLREVETILAAHGIVVGYEAIRDWSLRFGRLFASELRPCRPRPGDKWHLDEVFVCIRGELHYLRRAVDQDGHVLDILVQSRRDAEAAKRFFRKLPRGLQYVLRVIVTDKLRSYGAANRAILPGVEHRHLPGDYETAAQVFAVAKQRSADFLSCASLAQPTSLPSGLSHPNAASDLRRSARMRRAAMRHYHFSTQATATPSPSTPRARPHTQQSSKFYKG